MITIKYLFVLLISVFINSLLAQNDENGEDAYLELSWKQVATKMPTEWYNSDEARLVAENVLLSQKEIGGWAKNKPYHHLFSEEEKSQFLTTKSEVGATFDNGSTIMELQFLANVYSNYKDEKYKLAFIKGLDYIFESQYENGGWPQFYPSRKGKSVAYASHITYNDDAMVNILKFLRDIVYEKENYPLLQLDSTYKAKANQALENGVTCIIKTQIIVDGKPTVWCAQHDEVTLAPANARKYELASFSGTESASIALFLMTLKNPSQEIINSVDCAVKWFENHEVEDVKLIKEKDEEGRTDIVVVQDKTASPIWARFYDLETEKSFFCDRDGIKKNSLADIGYERRNGYDWYTTKPANLLEEYSEWKVKISSK
ncbi:MAG TPA: pectate lyase [Marinilabiliaceae bacterium]|nr:pectate lyase [Marinilabiliaceae bacterium]